MVGRGDKEYLANKKSRSSIKGKSRITVQSHTGFLFCLLSRSYLTSSKSTVIHYQCVSTGCCVHVARIKISIDNQHVTKPMQRYNILPEQPKEKA